MYFIKILYRKHLDMSSGKLAAQSVHAALGLMKMEPRDSYAKCVVLGAGTKAFEEAKLHNSVYVVTDSGKTEVKPGTETCLAYWEYEECTSDIRKIL